MALALFDLDDTLIEGNCETEWFHYLAENGHIDATQYQSDLAEFDRQYAAGAPDIDEYIRYVLRTLTEHPLQTLLAWRTVWLNKNVIPMIARGTNSLLQRHRDAGDTLLIISASTTFCVQPIAELLGVENFISTNPEMKNGAYTGEFIAPTCFAKGKITLINRWLKTSEHGLLGSHFYSDSHNDIPLLELAEYPVAVDADDQLKKVAKNRGWSQISLR